MQTNMAVMEPEWMAIIEMVITPTATTAVAQVDLVEMTEVCNLLIATPNIRITC